MNTDVCIIGAGIAGLTAAQILEKHRINYCILEQQELPGGRVQTDHFGGFLCDRGFQVLLPAYPSAKKYLDYKKLNLKSYPKGAVVITDKTEWFGIPFFYEKTYQLGTKLSVEFKDYINLFIDSLKGMGVNTQLIEEKTKEYINKRYSKELNEKFLSPFFSGVFIDQECTSSISLFRYYLKLFSVGGAAIPKKGMGEIPRQLVSNLNSGVIHYSSKVEYIKKNKVFCEDGKVVVAKNIIWAIDQMSINKLFNLPIHKKYKSREVSTYFFSVEKIKDLGPLTFVMNDQLEVQLSIPTLIQSSYSSTKSHLVMVTCLGNKKYDHSFILKCLSGALKQSLNSWQLVHFSHINHALPNSISKLKNIDNNYFCGDWLSFGSIESAMRSGSEVGIALANNLNTIKRIQP